MNLNHLREVGESYGQHLWQTVKYAFLFVGLATIILIHGLVPFILTNTASNKIKSLNEEFTNRNKREEPVIKTH